MAFDLSSIQKKAAMQAPRIMLYGVEGIGKTTFAAGAPSPIFLQTEDGLGSIDVPHFPLASSIDDVTSAIAALDAEHDYSTVVLDSVDWCDQLITSDIEKRHEAKDLAYGKGAVLAAEKWRELLAGFNHLRTARGMVVILIAHSQIKRFDSPETEPFDRYQPKLADRSSSLIREWADAVLFGNYRTVVKNSDVGFNKTVARGISTGERLLYTSERPAYMAKNRFSLPDSIPMTWDALQSAITATTK
jgi:hypothetical protein